MDENKYRKFKYVLFISCDAYSNKTYYFVLARFPCKWRRKWSAVVRTQIIAFLEKAQCFVAHWASIYSLNCMRSFSAEDTVFCGTLSLNHHFEFRVRSGVHAGWVLLTIYTLDVGMTVPYRKTVLMIRSQGNATHQNDTLSLYAGVCCGMIKMVRKCKSAG
jgi:hypothetical protein